MLRKVEQSRKIQGVSVNRYGPRVSHLLFADDSLLLSKATLIECRYLLHLLELYEMASRQKINKSKTSIFHSLNTSEAIRCEIQGFLGV